MTSQAFWLLIKRLDIRLKKRIVGEKSYLVMAGNTACLSDPILEYIQQNRSELTAQVPLESKFNEVEEAGVIAQQDRFLRNAWDEMKALREARRH